jgi:septal ring factor EnvC (AmiA/AmiB activator)
LEEIETLQKTHGDHHAKEQQLQTTLEQARHEISSLEFQLSESRTQFQASEDSLNQQIARLGEKERLLAEKVQDLSYQLAQAQRSAANTEQQETVSAQLEQEVRSLALATIELFHEPKVLLTYYFSFFSFLCDSFRFFNSRNRFCKRKPPKEISKFKEQR